jgi:putative ABC transport system ATP-binding protein
MSLLQISNLTKVYLTGDEHVRALDDVSFAISVGSFIAITGPSGSGKSTLLTVLGGLSHPTGGKVIIDEIDIYSLPGEGLADFRREYLGFVFQSFQLIPYLTVVENAMLPLAVTSLSRAEKQQRGLTILEKVGLDSKALRLPDELSGGEQQRVAIARALVNQPPMILADEPTGNLDSSTSNEIMKLLQELNAGGQTIIMVTHNSENLRFAERCIHLRDGRIQEQYPLTSKPLSSIENESIQTFI